MAKATYKILKKYESPKVVTYGKRALEFEPSATCSSGVTCDYVSCSFFIGSCAMCVTPDFKEEDD